MKLIPYCLLPSGITWVYSLRISLKLAPSITIPAATRQYHKPLPVTSLEVGVGGVRRLGGGGGY